MVLNGNPRTVRLQNWCPPSLHHHKAQPRQLQHLAFAQDPSSLAEGRVVAVRVEGNRRVEEAAVLALVQLREGDTLAAWKIQRDIKAIFRSGFFDDIQVDISDADAMGGKIVTFVVDEKPAVREVQITGNKKIEEEDIREVLDIKPFAVLNDADDPLLRTELGGIETRIQV